MQSGNLDPKDDQNKMKKIIQPSSLKHTQQLTNKDLDTVVSDPKLIWELEKNFLDN